MVQEIIETRRWLISQMTANCIKQTAFLGMKRNQYMTGAPVAIQARRAQKKEPRNMEEKR